MTATQWQLWSPNSCPLDLVTRACISARWQGYSNSHRLGLPFQISRERCHCVRRNKTETRRAVVSPNFSPAPEPWPSLKDSCYVSVFGTFPDPWGASLSLD